ncbi:MAG TPA: hypothetical protein VL287_00040 [Gemmatimonadales bacterium]|nr:hypothetical protein [Gemmatimonadales bacterium]
MAPKLCTILAVVASLGLTGVAAAQKAGVQVAAAPSRGDSTHKLATAGAPGDSSGASADPTETAVYRETFAYGGAPRDPFASLIKSAHVGPELAELQLVGIYEDLRYTGNSIAVLREKTSLKRYKLRQGEQLGRLRVSQIRSKDVVFTIEDFGYTRQETLSLRKQEDVAQ